MWTVEVLWERCDRCLGGGETHLVGWNEVRLVGEWVGEVFGSAAEVRVRGCGRCGLGWWRFGVGAVGRGAVVVV